MNRALADAAEYAAVCLSEHDSFPEVACLELIPDRAAGTVRTSVQLAATDNELAALVAVAEMLSGDVAVSVLRRDRPVRFTQVQVSGDAGPIPFVAWTHPSARELSALWSAVGHTPEIGVRARVGLDTLRAAADALSTTDEENAA